MATRFYFQSSGAGSPSVNPSVDAGWEITTGFNRRKTPYKNLTNFQISTVSFSSPTVPITTTQDILCLQWTSEPIRAQVITGTFSLVIGTSESDLGTNATLAVLLKVVSQDGSISRGTLFSVFGTDTEFGTSEATRIVNAQNVSSVTAQDGDRLVIEIGVTVTSPSVGTGQATLYYGVVPGAADFALTSGLTTLLNAWWELSQDLFPPVLNNYQSVKVGDGMSTGEKVR